MLQDLNNVERIANGSKVKRLLNNPFRYCFAILLKNAVYPFLQKEVAVFCRLFSGRKIKILLPASTDIYLTGGKSHPSEIKLSKFLILNLKRGDIFWDIGAHYGYFSMIAADLVGKHGQVLSVEASSVAFKMLAENCSELRNNIVLHNAVLNEAGKVAFYELPNLYSEYNSTDITQFEKETWFRKVKPHQVIVDAVSLDELYLNYPGIKNPAIIKIDVEGGELGVIEGGQRLFEQESPVIVMEYLEPNRNNEPHRKALNLLTRIGYLPYVMQKDGSLLQTNDIEHHLSVNNLGSDNIVFRKGTDGNLPWSISGKLTGNK